MLPENGDELPSGGRIENIATSERVVEKYCYDNDIENCKKYGGLYTRLLYSASPQAGQHFLPQGNQLSQDDGMLIIDNNENLNLGVRRSICPDGWRVATYSDWVALMGLVGEEVPVSIGDDNNVTRFELAGYALKSKSPFWDGGNTIGFTALPGGYYNGPEDGFFEKGEKAYFWLDNMRLMSDSDMTASRPGSGLTLGDRVVFRVVFLESLNDESQIKDVISSRTNPNAFSVRCVKISDDELAMENLLRSDRGGDS